MLAHFTKCNSFLFISSCAAAQMPVVGGDRLPRRAALLCRPLPFCSRQLHYGNLHGRGSSPNRSVCSEWRRGYSMDYSTCQQVLFHILFSSQWGRGQGRWVSSATVQERRREGRPGADEVVCFLSFLPTAALLPLQHLWPLCGGKEPEDGPQTLVWPWPIQYVAPDMSECCDLTPWQLAVLANLC